MSQPYGTPERGGEWDRAQVAQPAQQVPPAGAPAAAKPSWFKDLFNGVGYLLRGIGWVARHPLQWLFGLIPALIVLAVYAAALIFLAFQLGDLAEWVTPFAEDWSDAARNSARVIAGIAIFGAAIFLSLITFTAVTLLVGDPFYEAISERVERSQGDVPPEQDVPLMVSIGRAIGDTIVLALIALAFAVVLFGFGFVPVVGQTVVPVVALLVSGYYLAGELTSVAMDRRGLLRKERFKRMRANRSLVIGFGAATVVMFLIPLGAVLAMPGAVAGGTLLARERLAAGQGERERPVTPGRPGPAGYR